MRVFPDIAIIFFKQIALIAWWIQEILEVLYEYSRNRWSEISCRVNYKFQYF